MKESEFVADRLCILSFGEMKFIGTVEELRETYAKGYSVWLTLREKLSKESDKDRERLVKLIQEQLVKKFPPNSCQLKGKEPVRFTRLRSL